MKHLRSLREFITALDEIGEIQFIDKEVDWNLEIGAVARRSYELRAAAPIFNTIKDTGNGFRVFSAPGGLSARPGQTFARIALALGLPADAKGADIVNALAAARDRDPIPPVEIPAQGAPCKENVMLGDDVDLMKFPTPLIHDGDGGRYIQSFGLNIAKTPDGSWTNWSVNRMMLVDRNRLACLIPPPQHFGMIRALWAKEGKQMPVAVALGVEPGLPYVGGMPLPEGDDESAFLGAYFGEPLELVPAETVDLLVPATAEIVIEGYVSLEDTYEEGPMGEYPGYLDRGSSSPKPVLHVTAVTHRNKAILPVVVAGAPVEEDHTGFALPHAAEMAYLLRKAGLPVTASWSVLESAAHLWVAAVDPAWHETTGLSSQELCRKIGEVVFGSGKIGFGIPKLLVVEDDIDIADVGQVMWAFTTRAHPEHGEVHFDHESQNILPLYLDEYEKLSYFASKVVYNCLLADRFPVGQRPIAADFAHNWSPELQRHVVENWAEYGYE